MKVFKICLDSNREVKKEIVASTLEDLKSEIAITFELKKKKKKVNWSCLQCSGKGWNEKLKGYHIFLEDGTEIEDNDYYNELPSQTLLIVSKPSKFSSIFQDKMRSSKSLSEGTMQSMGQKNLLDLPNEVIQDNIMAFLPNQDLYKLIEVGNRRLTVCCYKVIDKRPYKDVIIVGGGRHKNRSSYQMRIKFKDHSEVTDVIYSHLPKYPPIYSQIHKFRFGCAINCEGRSIFFVSDDNAYNKRVYEFDNGGYHALPSLNISRLCASVCYINKQLVVMGGVGSDAKNSIETFRIDASSNDTEWKISQSSLPIPLYYHKTVEHQNTIILCGGFSNNVSNRAWEGQLSPANQFVWKEIGRMNYKRCGHFLFSFQNKVIVFGGNQSLSDNEHDRLEYLVDGRWELGPRVPFNFYTWDAQSVLDRQGRIIIISNEHGLIIFDIQKELFKHYPDYKLRGPRTNFTAILQ